MGGKLVTHMLESLRPIVVEWRDACTMAGWHMLEVAEKHTPMTVVDSGYFVAIVDGYLIIAPRYAHHPEQGPLVDEATAIPMSEVISISPRKETAKERLLRLKEKLFG